MTQFVIANNVSTQLAAAASSSATTLTLASSANLPALSAGQVMPLVLNDAATGQQYEVVYATDITGATLTVNRAQEGTGALNWNLGDYAYCAPTAGTVAMLENVQGGYYGYGTDTSTTANTLTAALSPAPAALSDGMVMRVKVKTTNTGASTLNLNSLGALPIVGLAGSALQGGELQAGSIASLIVGPGATGLVLLSCKSGPLQIAPATQSKHAAQLGQISGVVGQSRNAVMSIATASASGTFTANEIIVETTLGGLRYCLSSFSQTVNLATTGAGGMDTGSAPASGFVALYAIYNPTAGTMAILAANASSAVAPEVYGGANMPAGYTASALVGVWPTNSSSQFTAGYLSGRKIFIKTTSVLSSSTVGSLTAFSIAGVAPPNTKTVNGNISFVNTAAASMGMSIYGSSNGIASASASSDVATTEAKSFPFSDIPVVTSQTLYYTSNNNTGTPTFGCQLNGYTF